MLKGKPQAAPVKTVVVNVAQGKPKPAAKPRRALQPSQAVSGAVRRVPRSLSGYGDEAGFAAYIKSLVDPWSGPAHIPQRAVSASTVFSTKNSIVVTAKLNVKKNVYEICFVLRGGIRVDYAATNTLVQFGDVFQYYSTAGPTYLYQPSNGATQLQEQPGIGNDAGTYGVIYWDSTPEAESIHQSFQCIRKVSSGLRVSNVGKVLNTQGEMVVATIPGGQDIARYNNGSTPGADEQTGFTNQLLSYEQIKTLQDAKEYPVTEGASATWFPTGDGIDEWRPMKYVVSCYNVAGPTGIMGVNDCGPCDGAPQTFMATAEAETNSMALHYWTSIGEPPGMSANAQGSLTDLRDINDPAIVVCATALDPNAALLFEWVTNWEAVADTRAFSLTQPVHANGLNSDRVSMARSLAHNELPHSLPGRGASFGVKAEKFIRDAVAGFEKATNIGREIAPIAGTAFRAIGMPQAAAAIDGAAAATTVAELVAALAL